MAGYTLVTDSLESHYCLVAQQLPAFTPLRQAKLLEHLHSYTRLFTATDLQLSDDLHSLVMDLRKQYQRGAWRQRVEQISTAVARCAGTILCISTTDYPPQLKHIPSAPPLLYVRGNTNVLHLPQIAMVGSRRMSRDGETNALQWGQYLANAGFIITSGLAVGVDGAAHRGALRATESSRGTAVAVMATGIEQIYPRRHCTLADQILAVGGALVTEFEPGTSPLPARFPQRNRIISGLSLGVLVVEAAVKSGSLITARLALEQGREVFTIPGSINNPQARGCHLLIKQGAQLVERADELVAELVGPLAGLAQSLPQQSSELPADLSAEETAIVESLGFDAVDINSLNSPYSVEKTAQLLVGLELKGVVANDGGFYRRLL